MKIKKGDKVIVIAGADKGKVGTVQKAFPKLKFISKASKRKLELCSVYNIANSRYNGFRYSG